MTKITLNSAVRLVMFANLVHDSPPLTVRQLGACLTCWFSSLAVSQESQEKGAWGNAFCATVLIILILFEPI